MGDIASGLFGGGSSGSLGYGKGNNKTQMTYLGEGAGQAPLEDIMGRLAAEANQQVAQRNLINFGAGYGGSFESKDQEAARAAGGHLNSKPLGGWGGYGSENEALTGGAVQTPPGGGVPGGGDPYVPTDPRLPPDVPSTGGGGVRDPILPGTSEVPGDGPPRGDVGVTPAPTRGSEDPRGGPPGSSGGGGGGGQRYPTDRMVTGGGDEWARPASGGDGTTSGSGSLGGGGGGLAPGPETTAHRTATSQWDDPGMGDPFYRSEMKKQEAGGTKTNAYADQANAAYLKDPRIKATYDGLKALGYKNYLPDVGELVGVFSTTDLQPEDLLKHYGVLLQNNGGDESRVGAAGHGAEFRNMAAALGEKLGKGLYGKPAWSDDADAAAPVQASARPTSQFAGIPFDPLGKAGVAASAPQSYDAQQAKWDRTFGKAKAAAGTAKPAAPPARATASNLLGLKIAPGEEMAGYGRGTVTPTEGRAPTEGGMLTTGTGIRDGQGERAGALSLSEGDQDQQKLPAPDPDAEPPVTPPGGGLGAVPTTPTSNGRGARLSQFGPQGFNPGGGYAGGDAWSTSPEWRPEEPTGGLYGAYTELAGGKQTEYENTILNDWRNRAEGPMSELDADTLSSIKTFGRTPGRGEDEAYGAYNDMLQGGYSAAEQNAIAQEGMRAARAGFETNRDAMLRNQARTNNSAGYAANMGKMARGFSETMGTQARQNQIDFANEAQRRKEGGASGMLNVAGLSNQRGSTALNAQQQFAQEQARQKETALGGMQQAAGYGRDLQQKGLQGLQAMSAAQDPTKAWATAAGIGSAPRETYNETGSSSL